MNPNTQEIDGFVSRNFEFLKYNISNEWNDILLDNSYDPDLNFFCKNVKNLETVCFIRGYAWFSRKDSNRLIFNFPLQYSKHQGELWKSQKFLVFFRF